MYNLPITQMWTESFTPFLCLNRMCINVKQFLDLLFSSPYLKAQVSFFDCLWFLVCLSVCKLFTFFTSPEPLVQFQPKLTQISPGKGVLSLFKWRATWQSNAKIMNPDQSHTYKWKTIQNECMANTDPWIYQRWDQVHRRSKHPLLTGHTHREFLFQGEIIAKLWKDF